MEHEILGMSIEHPTINAVLPNNINPLLNHTDTNNAKPFAITIDTHPCLAQAIPVSTTICQIVLFRTLDEIETEVEAFQLSILLLDALGFILTLVFGIWASGRISTPTDGKITTIGGKTLDAIQSLRDRGKKGWPQ